MSLRFFSGIVKHHHGRLEQHVGEETPPAADRRDSGLRRRASRRPSCRRCRGDVSNVLRSRNWIRSKMWSGGRGSGVP